MIGTIHSFDVSESKLFDPVHIAIHCKRTNCLKSISYLTFSWSFPNFEVPFGFADFTYKKEKSRPLYCNNLPKA